MDTDEHGWSTQPFVIPARPWPESRGVDPDYRDVTFKSSEVGQRWRDSAFSICRGVFWRSIPGQRYDEASVMQGDHPERHFGQPFGPPDLRKAIAKALPGQWEDTTEVSASEVQGSRLLPDI